jgi:hypothetical protein
MTATPPRLDRLERMAVGVDRNRIALHVPGAALVPFRMTATRTSFRQAWDHEVGGVRVPHHYIKSTAMGGRTIFQVERVEIGVELAPDTFTLQSFTESGPGK